MGTNRFQDSDIGKLVRGAVVIIAAALMILPAYINYELFKTGFNPVVSMAISLQLFAIGVVLFIVAVGKERFMPKPQPQ
jgi:ABC-type sulfate transport system permease component